MGKDKKNYTKTFSLHYTHHPSYVLDIHEKLIGVLNEQRGLQLKDPEIQKLGPLGKREEFYVSEFWGVRVRTTTREEDDNDLYVDIDENKWPTNAKSLRGLVQGHEDILGKPVG